MYHAKEVVNPWCNTSTPIRLLSDEVFCAAGAIPSGFTLKEEDVMVLQYKRRLLMISPSDSGQSLTASLPNSASHVMSRPSVLVQIPFVSQASDVVVIVVILVVDGAVVVDGPVVVVTVVVVDVVVVVVVEVCSRAELCFPVHM